MTEYITKADVIAKLDRFARDPYHDTHYIRAEAVSAIGRMEAADVQEVRHGQWMPVEDVYMDTCFKCSECGLEFYLADGGTPKENEYNYCPNCGAKNEEEKHEDDGLDKIHNTGTL